MKLKEVYNNYKEKYKEYVILIKCGNFYEALGDDAYLMNKIFDYKIKELSNIKKVGFPIIALNRVINRLDSLKVNYLVYENGVSTKRKFNRNKYKRFFDILGTDDRIELIYRKLMERKNDNIEVLLKNIEELL